MLKNSTRISSAEQSAVPKETAHSSRLNFVEGMRASAALYVVISHIASLVDPSHLVGKSSTAPLGIQRFRLIFDYGHLAVAAFIVISGFCLRWAALERRDPNAKAYKSFLLRRFRRILPPYYLCLIISLIVARTVSWNQKIPPFSIYVPFLWSDVLTHVFMIQNLQVSSMYKINGVLWSISIEFQIYFLFRLFGLSLKKIGGILTLVIAGLFAWGVLHTVPGALKLYPWFIGLFILGMISADAARKRQYKVPQATLLGLLFIGALAFGIYQDWSMVQTDVLMGACTAFLLFVGTRTKGKSFLVSFFRFRPLVFIGSFSYSLYLMHHPILQTLDVFRPEWANQPIPQLLYLLFVGIPTAILLSFLFGYLVEGKYVRKALRQLFAKST